MESTGKSIVCAGIGYIHMECTLVQVIDTVEFQRLRYVKQTGAVHWVYPGAVHTRFEHSIGVAKVAENLSLALSRRHPELLIDPFVFKLAGLCHDMGHGPMSHAYDVYTMTRDDVPIELRTHESRSVALLRHVVAEYSIAIPEAVLEMACELIHPCLKNLPTYAYEIIASNIDADKLDYLPRDCARTGEHHRPLQLPKSFEGFTPARPLVTTGIMHNVDVTRYIEFTRVVDGVLCYPFNMKFDISHLFFIRHQLHCQAYQHPAVRAIEHMHIDVLTLLGAAVTASSIESFIKLSDLVFTPCFVSLAIFRGDVDAIAGAAALELLHRIEKRDLYRHVATVATSSIAQRRIDHPPPARAIVDDVRVGYAQNPVLQTLFYEHGSPPRPLRGCEVSNTFALNVEDSFTHIYARSSDDEQAIKDWLMDVVHNSSVIIHPILRSDALNSFA